VAWGVAARATICRTCRREITAAAYRIIIIIFGIARATSASAAAGNFAAALTGALSPVARGDFIFVSFAVVVLRFDHALCSYASNNCQGTGRFLYFLCTPDWAATEHL
jgi:hypothetical protein